MMRPDIHLKVTIHFKPGSELKRCYMIRLPTWPEPMQVHTGFGLTQDAPCLRFVIMFSLVTNDQVECACFPRVCQFQSASPQAFFCRLCMCRILQTRTKQNSGKHLDMFVLTWVKNLHFSPSQSSILNLCLLFMKTRYCMCHIFRPVQCFVRPTVLYVSFENSHIERNLNPVLWFVSSKIKITSASI